MRQLFNEDAKVTYAYLRDQIRDFLQRESCYSAFEKISLEKLNILERVIVKREQHPAQWLEAFELRLKEEHTWRKRNNKLWAKPEDVFEWLLKDLRCYFVDKARFSFREYFQPPLALISDPRCLHTSDTVSFDDVLRVVRFYVAKFFNTSEEWEQKAQRIVPEKAKEANIYCQLQELREPGEQLRLGLKLDAGDSLRTQWEERFAYQLTALYGLEVVALNDSHGLTSDVQHLFSESFIPALAVADRSRSAVEMWRLQKKAQYIPYSLQVTFADDEVAAYWVILGTMALQVHAEIPVGILKYNWGKAARSDNNPMML